MFKIPLQLLEHRCIQDQRSKVEHEGFCPNKLNSNLWVDAQSTCERECYVDEDCADFEKCCTNVCGLNSCVAARFSDGTPAQPDGEGVTEAPISTATCEGFICSQQGATCGIWLGQPICKCQDRCEKEPNFTCASDGLTYFNRCYMDAEACIRGVTITVVTCRFYLAGPPTSPLPQDTTANPTPTSSQEDPMFPMLYSNPHHQSVYVGGTVSFHCDVTGSPKPDVTWEKQSERREQLVMRPDQMYGNVVITNIGQLVIYNAQVWDTGIYTALRGTLRGFFEQTTLCP
ncbi:WAP Kazal immunoglobulin Kunitz and NTR domain containing protein [Dissostichus eleginoides]|nr:WAP Kazal immunoglobulin Kunitz and NTR domain containing protein [Dissostichus eleginoides]